MAFTLHISNDLQRKIGITLIVNIAIWRALNSNKYLRFSYKNVYVISNIIKQNSAQRENLRRRFAWSFPPGPFHLDFVWGARTSFSTSKNCQKMCCWTSENWSQNVYSHPSSDVLMTYAATLSIPASERRPLKAGIAFFPFVTCVRTDFSVRPPARKVSRASFSSVFSGIITFCPPAWHAAQLSSKIFSPWSGFPAWAGAGEMQIPSAMAPAQAAWFDKTKWKGFIICQNTFY